MSAYARSRRGYGSDVRPSARWAAVAAGDAVDAASTAADRKTQGKYTAKIAEIGQKVGEAVGRAAGSEGAGKPDVASRSKPGPASSGY